MLAAVFPKEMSALKLKFLETINLDVFHQSLNEKKQEKFFKVDRVCYEKWLVFFLCW